MNSEDPNKQSINSDEISLKDVVFKAKAWGSYILSKWMIILLFGIIGGALGFLYASSKKMIYTASTTFVLEDASGGGVV